MLLPDEKAFAFYNKNSITTILVSLPETILFDGNQLIPELASSGECPGTRKVKCRAESGRQ